MTEKMRPEGDSQDFCAIAAWIERNSTSDLIHCQRGRVTAGTGAEE